MPHPRPRTSPRPRSRVIVWAHPDQEDLIREAIEVAQLELIAVASDRREGASVLSEAFGVERLGDLRDAIQHPDLDVLWLAAPLPIEAQERKLIRESGHPALSLEPRPGEIAALCKQPEDADTARFIPLLRRSEAFQNLQQMLQDAAPPHSLSLSFRGRPEHGTLFARLFDAMDLIDHLCGDVESVSASLAIPEFDAHAPAPRVPDSLFNLHGHMSVNFNFAENRCASAVLSNVSDSWFRGVTMLSETGSLRLTDRECHWRGAPDEMASFTDPEPITAGRLVGESIRRRLDNLDHDVHPPNFPRLLALCEAARLSCRTGQAESPSRMLAMLSHV
ncbi:MAG: hypothetical protein O7G85_09180 [Planctomycetota bacterium]|nr:hypothetical protein [Planctomycetota bacterium]